MNPFTIERDKQTLTTYEIVRGDGKQIPDALKGSFTKKHLAEQAINLYLASKEKKGGKSPTV